MYPGMHAKPKGDQPAFIMAQSGETVTYAELEARTNQLAHFLRSRGLKRLDHYAIFMENNARYLECCGAGERAGLYFTCINSFLTPQELAYIINNSESKVLIFSEEKRAVAIEALSQCPKVEAALVVNGPGDGNRILNFDDALASMSTTPIADESVGTAMLYSSGTTGQPKGIIRPLPEQPPSQQLPLFDFLQKLWRYREGLVYLSPAPLYHSAPQAAVNLVIRNGGTAIIMENFDPEHYLQLVEKYRPTHSQLVPTMFSRMLKLPRAEREGHDLSSLEVVIHAAAPCPSQVKEQMIEWWGPIIHEYYGATEGLGFAACDSAQWLALRGTVGKVMLGDLHVLDEDATMSTVGDVGYVDDDGFLYLTDRATFMIVSGGVNIYPQECENLLITHPKIADAAVFGIPNEDLGEEVKAVVQVMPGIPASSALSDELIAFCAKHLSRQKCPRSVDFEAELPRLPTGKLYKRLLRDRYWGDRKSRII